MNENQASAVPETEAAKKKMDAGTIVKIVSAVVIVASLVVIFVYIFNNSITASEFNQIKNGMTYEEVCEIVGCEGELGVSSSYGSYSGEAYTFKGTLYHISGANAAITFSNGRVSAKAAVGLIF